MNKPLGVILAGGRGLRMNGLDKAQCLLGGRPLIDHVFERLAPQVERVAINANGDADRFSRFDVPLLADPFDGFLGPMSGVLAGMDWARGLGASHIVTAATDTPFFPLDMVEKLQEVRASVVVARSAGRRHPVFALWEVSLADQMRTDIAAGARRIGVWADEQGAEAVSFDVSEGDPFYNINTADDLQMAEKFLR